MAPVVLRDVASEAGLIKLLEPFWQNNKELSIRAVLDEIERLWFYRVTGGQGSPARGTSPRCMPVGITASVGFK
jgi:hypothetical protein